MKIVTIFARGLAILTLIGVIMAAYLFWARPYQLRWGATAFEVNRSMPGDELHGNPTFLATRAITIEETPENIWPWLIQMGYGRAGFYGYDILENLGSERGIRSADRILPEFQDFTAGDEVPISAVFRLFFNAIEPNKYLVWSGETGEYQGAFTWALYPLDKNHTRLASRIGWSYHWTEPSLLALDLFTEFTDHIAVRKILKGVKGRVEGHVETLAKQNIEFVIYVLLFMIFLFALFFLLLRPLTWKTWLAGLASGVAWLLTWYAPIPIWSGAILGLLVLLGLRRAFRASAQDEGYLKLNI